MFRLFIISFLIYLVVNLFENIIHYNIGKYSNKKTHFDIPTRRDWIKIILVMVCFAALQGSLTCLLDNRCN